jgi:Flp pilus assembly protein TadG
MTMIIHTDKKQHGLAAIEFAIVVPVMLFLMMATAEFGRVFYHYNTLTKAVQTGARYASKPLLTTNKLTDLTIDGFKQEIQNFVAYGNESGTGIAVLDGFSATDTNVAVTSSMANKTITIEAQYTYNFVVLSDLPFIGYILPTLTLKSSVVTDTSLG